MKDFSSERRYYENPDNVSMYSRFDPTHDGAELVDVLQPWLAEGATVLELGTGPGKDFELLSRAYRVTGSDFSLAFLDYCREKFPDADLLHLDALTIETNRHFDAIFSNKVLVHMTAEQLEDSFARQHERLNAGGIILHSFWRGEGEHEFGDLTLRRRAEHDLRPLVERHFEILALEPHAKMKEGDSVYVLARAKQ